MSAAAAHDHDHAHGHDPGADDCCGHVHGLGSPELLDFGARRILALRLTLAVVAAGLLLLSLAVRTWVVAAADVADLLAAAAALLVGIPTFVDAWKSLRQPSLHGVTDQLVAAALLAAWASGDLASAALVPLVMVIGHVLEDRSLLGSREAIAALGKLTTGRVRRLRPDGGVDEVESAALARGDRLELRAGDRVPADGVVRDGSSSIDTSSITGESVPTEVAVGDAVDAGTINLAGRLEVEVTRLGKETTLGRVVELMRDAERAKPPITRLLEKHAQSYLVLVLLTAAATWLLTSNVAFALAVLVASCPCALVLAAPATSIASLAVAARHGVLVRGTAFLEELAEVDAVILDKTGTVTLGELRLLRAVPHGASANTAAAVAGVMTRLAGSIGAASSHPVSHALAKGVAVADRLRVDGVQEVGGKGVWGRLADGGAELVLGRRELLLERGVVVPELPPHDGPVVGLARGGTFLGWLLLADEPRAEAREALADLRELGLKRQLLVTGDRRSVALQIAAQLGIDEVAAEVLPEQKLAKVTAEIAAGRRPLVVGDGVNDALALKAGAVGVAMGARGTDVALASSDLVLMSSDLRRLGTCIRLSRKARRAIAVNVAIGLGWTVLVLALAAVGKVGALLAAFLHNAGTLAVLANAGRLLRFDELHLDAAKDAAMGAASDSAKGLAPDGVGAAANAPARLAAPAGSAPPRAGH